LLFADLDAAGRADFDALARRIDPRLSAPGLWLAASYRPDEALDAAARSALDRLAPAARTLLAHARPSSVLRDLDGRTDWAWRVGFTRTAGERARMARQFVVPERRDLQGGRSATARAHAARLVRAARRARAGRRGGTGGP
ncbi:MAG: hypothetical protein OEY23_05810, partial [Acidimicrobiia bacterium]|nr:hypothetical protein [Acidimicrobiia bacterium]